VNRDEKTKRYLSEQLDIFKGFRSFNSRDEFFPTVNKFRETTIRYLKGAKIVNQKDIDELDNLLAKIDTKKTKGINNKVYWNGVTPVYDQVISKLNHIILDMNEIKIPFKLRVKDIIAENYIKIIVGILTTSIIVSYFLGLANKVINFFVSLFH
jgi:hypothetical protein